MDIRLDALPSDPAALQAIVRAQATALLSRDTLIDRLKAQLAALKRARASAPRPRSSTGRSRSWSSHSRTERRP
jgi:hypothetical protein